MGTGKGQCYRAAKNALVALAAVLIGLNMSPLENSSAKAGTHKENMKEMCKRTREVNAQGLGGEGYFYWFFNKNKLAPPSAVPSFWAEVKAHCPGAW